MLCLVLTDPNTPGAAGGPGDRGRTLAVKSQKIAKKSAFLRKKIKITYIFSFVAYIFLLYQNIGGNKFSHTGDSPKLVKSERRREKEEEKKRRKTERW